MGVTTMFMLSASEIKGGTGWGTVFNSRGLRKAVGLCFSAAIVLYASATTANQLFSIQEELSAIKSQLLQLMDAGSSDHRYAYLDIDSDLALRGAELQILDAHGSVSARIRFSPGGTNRPMLRAAIPYFVHGSRRCRFIIETSDGSEVLRRALNCQLPPLQSASMLELRFREGWFKPNLRILLWQSDIEPKTDGSRNRDQLSGLLRRMVPSVTTNSLTRTDEGRAAAPDVRYSVVLCQQDPWHGLNRLYYYKRRYGDALPAAFWWAYADCALSAGVRGEAIAALHQLEGYAASRLPIYNIQLQLAAYDHSWGNTTGALEWLVAEPGEIPVELRTRWRDLKSRLLLDQGRFARAVKLLSRGRHLEAAGSWLEPFDAARLHYAMRINYAYALMSVGRKEGALAVLDRVGSSSALDNETRALRSQANIMLGWYFLKQGYGATAGRIFHRIPTQGLVARKALLGMGWAMLAPKGDAQPLIAPPGFIAVPSDPPRDHPTRLAENWGNRLRPIRGDSRFGGTVLYSQQKICTACLWR